MPEKTNIGPNHRIRKTLRCVSWSAVSSEGQASDDKESLPEQKRLNRQYIESIDQHYIGYEGSVVTEMEHVGSRDIIELSDACTYYPETYGLLRTMIESNEVDAIVVRDISRLGRQLSLFATIRSLAAQHNCVIIARDGSKPSLNGDGYVGMVLTDAVQGSMAQIEVHKLVERRRTGMRGRIERKKLFPSNVPYGYEYVYSGGEIVGIAQVHHEARIIRRILVDEYTNRGLGGERIAKGLTEDGILTPSGKDTWTAIMVRSIVSKARTYAGYLRFNERSGSKYRNPSSGQTRIPNKQEIIETVGIHTPIITKAELEAIEAEKATRSNSPRTRLFGGSTICAKCGQPMVGGRTRLSARDSTLVDIMRCNNPDCLGSSIREHFLMEALLDAITKVEESADDEVIAKASSISTTSIEADIVDCKKQLSQLREKRERAVGLLVDGTISREEFELQNTRLQQQTTQTDNERARLQASLLAAQDANRTSERVEEVRKSARLILQESDDHIELVRGWIRRHFRLIIGTGRGIDRVTVELI